MIKENEYGTAERQNILLSMMKDVHSYCEKESIKYSLCGGTMLGAVRHKGFIPWDDDVDILLDRKNYNKFVEKFESCKGYKLQRDLWIMRVEKIGMDSSVYKDSLPPRIDLFIVDNCPDGKLRSKLKILRLRILQGMINNNVQYKGLSFPYKCCLFTTHLFGKFFTYNFKWKRYMKISQKGNKKPTKFVTTTNDLFKLLPIKYNSYLLDNVALMPFEDTAFYVSTDYHHALTAQYGDYMTPPKMEDRIAFHMNSKPAK